MRFVNRPAQRVAGGFGGLVVFIGIGGLLSRDWTGLAWIAVGLLFAYRGLTTSLVIVKPDEIDLRGFGRRHRVRVNALSSVEVAVGRTGMNGFGREHLVFHHLDGTATAFKDLNAKPSTTKRTVVQDAAAAIDRQLHPGV